MSVDNSQNVFVTGTQNNGSDYDCLTLKYSAMSAISQISLETPDAFSLKQNYPNPFNPETVINYSIKIAAHVNLKVYDVIGKEIETLVNEKHAPGSYRVIFNGSQLPSGVYFVKLETDSPRESRKFTDVKKMILEK